MSDNVRHYADAEIDVSFDARRCIHAVADGGAPAETNEELSITASANGPLLVQGAFTLRGAGGQGQYRATNAELCRCGGSGHKPFCDGTHQLIGFRSEEAGVVGGP